MIAAALLALDDRPQSMTWRGRGFEWGRGFEVGWNDRSTNSYSGQEKVGVTYHERGDEWEFHSEVIFVTELWRSENYVVEDTSVRQ